jgi:lysophospholipase L1-like esterase
MKNPLRFLLLLTLYLGCLTTLQAQQKQAPFWKEIQAFKRQDSLQQPPKQAILFVGSSSFKMWDNMQEMFPAHQLINRGFGGSNLLDLKLYLNDIVFPYEPRQIVIYSGENDIASGTVDAKEVVRRFDAVFTAIREKLPQVPVVFVSIKPSPSRAQYLPVMQEANALIKYYLQKRQHTAFVDVYQPMLTAAGKPRPEIFISDNLHLNQQGYQIWHKAIEPHLIENKP